MYILKNTTSTTAPGGHTFKIEIRQWDRQVCIERETINHNTSKLIYWVSLKVFFSSISWCCFTLLLAPNSPRKSQSSLMQAKSIKSHIVFFIQGFYVQARKIYDGWKNDWVILKIQYEAYGCDANVTHTQNNGINSSILRTNPKMINLVGRRKKLRLNLEKWAFNIFLTVLKCCKIRNGSIFYRQDWPLFTTCRLRRAV